MIEFLDGTLIDKNTGHIVLNVNGVGYGLDVPIPVFYEMGSVGSKCRLFVSTYVREDQLRLFGFLTIEAKKAFEVLIGISGVGPKVGLAILSSITLGLLKEAVEANESRIFEQVPGIGKRTAEKILVELKGKVSKLPAGISDVNNQQTELGDEGLREDLISALVNLGYKEKEIRFVVDGVMKEQPGSDFSQIVKVALQELQADSKNSGRTSRSDKTSQNSRVKPSRKELNTLF